MKKRRYGVIGFFGAFGSLMSLVLSFEDLKFFARERRFAFSSLICAGDNFEIILLYSCRRDALTDSARVFQVYSSR